MLRIIGPENRIGRFSWGRGYNIVIWSTCDFCDTIVARKAKTHSNFLYTEYYIDPYFPTEEELNEKHFCNKTCKEEWEELYKC